MRAGLALAALGDPEDSSLASRWQENGASLSELLAQAASENHSDAEHLANLARIADERWLAGLAPLVWQGESEAIRSAAAILVADLASGRLPVLCDTLAMAPSPQFRVLLTALRKQPTEQVVPRLQSESRNAPLLKVESAAIVAQSGRQANAALALFELGYPHELCRLLRTGAPTTSLDGWGWAAEVRPVATANDELTARTLLIDRLASLRVSVDRLIVEFHARPQETALRRGLLLAIGSMLPLSGPRSALQDETSMWSRQLRLFELFRTESDPGLHAAIRWLLVRLGQGRDVARLEKELVRGSPVGGQGWYVNREGQTLAVLGPAALWMGSPPNEPNREHSREQEHQKRIPRVFAISMHEVKVNQFEKVFPQQVQALRDEGDFQVDSDEIPMHMVTWFEAAEYCNRLSMMEGLEPCYREDRTLVIGNRKIRTFTPVPDALNRPGYRLPTEAEWEFACRSGSSGPWFFGHAESPIEHYAWLPRTSPDGWKWPVGLKRPNEFGLFDVYGNAVEWCHDGFAPDPDKVNVDRGGISVNLLGERVLRGRAAGDVPAPRSAYRETGPPHVPLFAAGFRVARTISVDADTNLENNQSTKQPVVLLMEQDSFKGHARTHP